jgi:hypothetical protein
LNCCVVIVALTEDKEAERSVGVGVRDVTAHCRHYFKSTWLLLLLVLDKRLIFRIYAVLFCYADFPVSSQTVRNPDIWAKLIVLKTKRIG